MTSAYILIAAMLLLGGLIAVIGDRLGTKVGKARLRLFNLRPRQTATVVTIITGTIISASTLTILFSLSESLRQGVFELDDILKKRRKMQAELEEVIEAKKQIERQLNEAETQADDAQKRLEELDEDFQKSTALLKTISRQAKTLREDVNSLENERQELENLRNQLLTEINKLQNIVKQRDQELAQQNEKIATQDQILAELENRQAKLQAEIRDRDELITELDANINLKDKELKIKEIRLKNLESQLVLLKGEVEILKNYYQNYQILRERQIAIFQGQVLSFGVIRIINTDAFTEAIDRLLRQANRIAIEAIQTEPKTVDERVVQITNAQVKQVQEEIKAGEEYVMRILSAGNYVKGENNVRVFADVALNQQVFEQGEKIATVSLETENISENNIKEKLDLLLSIAQFQAKNEGILGEITAGNGDIITLVRFLEKLKKEAENIDEIEVVAGEKTYTAGPLKLRLLAKKNGKVIFSTY